MFVVVCPVTVHGELLLIRYTEAGHTAYRLPCGQLAGADDPFAYATFKLRKDVGCECTGMHSLGCYQSPGHKAETVMLLLARECDDPIRRVHNDVVHMTLSDAQDTVLQGMLPQLVCMSTVLMAIVWLQKHKSALSAGPPALPAKPSQTLIKESQETDEMIRIRTVKDVFPDLGDGFILACLTEFGWSVERVIDGVLNNSLPQNLAAMDRSTPRRPSHSKPLPPIPAANRILQRGRSKSDAGVVRESMWTQDVPQEKSKNEAEPSPYASEDVAVTAYEYILWDLGVANLGKAELLALDTIRVQLGVSSRQHKRILLIHAGLNDKSNVGPMQRIQLLECVHETEFDGDADRLKAWQRRQIAFVLDTLIFALRHCKDKEVWQLDGVTTQPESSLQALLQDAKDNDELPMRRVLDVTTQLASQLPRDQRGRAVGYSFPLNIHLYRALLLGVLDRLEGSGMVSNSHDVILFLHRIREDLSISECLHTLCHTANILDLYFDTEAPDLMSLLRGTNLLGHTQDLTTVMKHVTDGGDEYSFVQQVIHPLSEKLGHHLHDYHRFFGLNPHEIGAALDVYMSVTRSHEQSQVMCEAMIRSATQHHYQRTTATVARPFGLLELQALAETLVDELSSELQNFVPQFGDYHRVACVAFAGCLQPDVSAAFRCINILSKEAIDVLSPLRNINEIAKPYGMQVLDLFELYSPLLSTWMVQQQTNMEAFMERSLHMEKWAPLSGEAREKYSSSVVDLFSLLTQTTDILLGLEVPQMDVFVRTLCNLMDSVVQDYSRAVLKGCGPRCTMIPPEPMLTLCPNPDASKKKGFKKLVSGLKSSGDGFHESLANTMSAELIESTRSRMYDRLEELCMRLNALDCSVVKLENLENRIRTRCCTLEQEGMINGLFARSRDVLDASCLEVMDYIATKLVFLDLREPFLDGLYVPNVNATRLSNVLDCFDPVLRYLCETVVPRRCNHLAFAIYRAFVASFERVLLNGGVRRVFEAGEDGDSFVFYEDLETLQDFFVAADETGVAHGLPRQEVCELSEHLRQIILLYDQKPDDLLRLYLERHRDNHPAQFPFTRRNLQCALYHIHDAGVRKFLKSGRLPESVRTQIKSQ